MRKIVTTLTQLAKTEEQSSITAELTDISKSVAVIVNRKGVITALAPDSMLAQADQLARMNVQTTVAHNGSGRGGSFVHTSKLSPAMQTYGDFVEKARNELVESMASNPDEQVPKKISTLVQGLQVSITDFNKAVAAGKTFPPESLDTSMHFIADEMRSADFNIEVPTLPAHEDAPTSARMPPRTVGGTVSLHEGSTELNDRDSGQGTKPGSRFHSEELPRPEQYHIPLAPTEEPRAGDL
jgi:hypothetical protein